MSAALKSYVPRPLPVRPRVVTASPQNLLPNTTALPEESRPRVSPPVVLPTAPLRESSDVALRVLSRLHLVSSVLAVSVVGLALVSYGTSVYIGRQLNQATQKLSHLQRSEQQLTTANEVLKNYLAQQVQVGQTGLQPPQPSSVIFLKPSPRAAAIALPKPLTDRLPLPKVEVPLGY